MYTLKNIRPHGIYYEDSISTYLKLNISGNKFANDTISRCTVSGQTFVEHNADSKLIRGYYARISVNWRGTDFIQYIH